MSITLGTVVGVVSAPAVGIPVLVVIAVGVAGAVCYYIWKRWFRRKTVPMVGSTIRIEERGSRQPAAEASEDDDEEPTAEAAFEPLFPFGTAETALTADLTATELMALPEELRALYVRQKLCVVKLSQIPRLEQDYVLHPNMIDGDEPVDNCTVCDEVEPEIYFQHTHPREDGKFLLHLASCCGCTENATTYKFMAWARRLIQTGRGDTVFSGQYLNEVATQRKWLRCLKCDVACDRRVAADHVVDARDAQVAQDVQLATSY